MHGAKKSAKFGLMRRGEYIGVSVLLNTLTKFAKLQVGKHAVTAKQRSSHGIPLFPLTIALNGFHPLAKVWVEYLPQPNNTFVIKVNDDDIYVLPKEEVDFDPTKTEPLYVDLNVNNKQVNSGYMPWIINDVSEKIESALGMDPLNSLEVMNLQCNSTVANEFLDLLCGYDLPEQGLEKLRLVWFMPDCEPFEEEVLTRLSNLCLQLSHLQISHMYGLTKAGKL